MGKIQDAWNHDWPKGRSTVAEIIEGLRHRGVLTPDDDLGEFLLTQLAFVFDLHPVTPREGRCVGRIGIAAWELQRLWRRRGRAQLRLSVKDYLAVLGAGRPGMSPQPFRGCFAQTNVLSDAQALHLAEISDDEVAEIFDRGLEPATSEERAQVDHLIDAMCDLARLRQARDHSTRGAL